DAHILAALQNAHTTTQVSGDAFLLVGSDDRGVELELIVLPDDRRADGRVVIHAMPTAWRQR
ncbi:MAG TPA: hypothetical protein VFC16_02965, partial [Nakamurella sp.]|nr:hypothetical protein [Nakamurella sp.]